MGTELTLELKTYMVGKNTVKLKRAKNPSTPGFELPVTQCLVGATLSSPPGGMDFFP